MQTQKPDQPSALLRAADIPDVSQSLRNRITRAIAGQTPIYKPDVAAADDRIDPQTFSLTEEGSGAFGKWTLDADQLPAYTYDMNQRRDVRAYYINSEGRDRRNHWHQLGNDRVTALASNDGTIQVYLADRGGIFLNRFADDGGDPPHTLIGYLDALLRLLVRGYNILWTRWVNFRSRNAITPRGTPTTASPTIPSAKDMPGLTTQFAYSGGFGYLDDGKQTWATAYRYGPDTAQTRRVFGIGYYETEMIYQDIRHTQHVYAPHGNDPLLLIDVEIENRRTVAVDLHYYAYWDVNVQQLKVEWVRTGLAAPNDDGIRSRINERFVPSMKTDIQALRFHQERRPGVVIDGEAQREVDGHPLDVFLANLSDRTADDYYVDKGAFFGTGTAVTPDAVQQRRSGETDIQPTSNSMPYCMVFRHDLHLEPGATIKLRFAYGAAQPDDSPLDFLKKYDNRDWLKDTLQAWKGQLTYFSTGNDPVLQREMAWHSYNLVSATLYSERYLTHYTPQGSAYLYLHGADGVPRDQALFTLPMVYVRPALARQILTLIMSLRQPPKQSGRPTDSLTLPYAFIGNGAVSDADGLHHSPSDLDLFFLLAISEYLAATGDFQFLTLTIPYYSLNENRSTDTGISVLDHMRDAVTHLEIIGIGDNGLLKIGDGDWDDAIVIETALKNVLSVNRSNSIQFGESVPNSQMALYVLPLVAAQITRVDPVLAARLGELTTKLKGRIGEQWNPDKGWFNRAILRNNANQKVIIGDNHLSLQAQFWPLISGLATDMNIEPQLIETIKTLLDDPSPTGAMLEVKGQVWPAVSQLLTWGYRRSRPDLAWRSLNRHTFATHASTFPNVWFNIWSGPDGTNSKLAANPGGTWASPVTPMTDFPVMNANQDAMALLGLLRVCGVEPSMNGDGLDIMPQAPPERFVLNTQLLHLDVAPGRISGEYRPIVAGNRTFHIHLPTEAAEVTASVNNVPLALLGTNPRQVDIPLNFSADQKMPFEVHWH